MATVGRPSWQRPWRTTAALSCACSGRPAPTRAPSRGRPTATAPRPLTSLHAGGACRCCTSCWLRLVGHWLPHETTAASEDPHAVLSQCHVKGSGVPCIVACGVCMAAVRCNGFLRDCRMRELCSAFVTCSGSPWCTTWRLCAAIQTGHMAWLMLSNALVCHALLPDCSVTSTHDVHACWSARSA